ncbi:hypothetical protein M3664_04825 [Paenibacillus lautus]|uniref:hypothetical protein n=1 Tax=Paenibacillus lautus TaxID=1401 RepID=UPI00203E5655|nr:hypothetical protein [Paenibacillus lautus]MCM3257106.1 hypothetical protein [Paenibacillus lautus]
MHFTILNSYSKVERWSAYDTDEIYYVTVVDDKGKEHTFSELHPLSNTEICKRIENIQRDEERKQRMKMLIEKKKSGSLIGTEAVELLDLIIK